MPVCLPVCLPVSPSLLSFVSFMLSIRTEPQTAKRRAGVIYNETKRELELFFSSTPPPQKKKNWLMEQSELFRVLVWLSAGCSFNTLQICFRAHSNFFKKCRSKLVKSKLQCVPSQTSLQRRSPTCRAGGSSAACSPSETSLDLSVKTQPRMQTIF